ncbi:MAG TPA: putative Ig domain-containing protein [Blastocatellia bacterium]|nr:putative Ig domain-containing protein [Blastocatellia bacterium]
MVRLSFTACAALLLFITSNGFAQTHTHNALQADRSPTAWMSGYTLVLVDTDSKAELAQARDFIVEQGGRVAVVVPPRAILGWITPEVGSKIIGRHRIRSIHRTAVDPGATGFNDRETQIAIGIFNDIASGRRARQIRSEIRRAETPDLTNRPPMYDCALPRPEMSRDDFIRNLRALGAMDSLNKLNASITPNFFNNSDTMDGSVAVAVFLIESNGGIDPNVYNWSQADQNIAIAKIIDGLNWWVDQSRAFALPRPLQFTVVPHYADNPACQQPYEPVLRPGSDSFGWISRIMTNLGMTSSDPFVNVATYNRVIRDQNQANWAFSVFIAYNPPPARTSFTDGRASWAYLGGPLTNILFRSYGWDLNQIVSHETGHIFYSCDEYSQPGFQTCSCTCSPEVRPQAANGNCEESSCNRNSTPCMMRVNEFALCQYTVAQIGWTARVPDPIPTAPAGLIASAGGPTQVNLVWQDTSSTESGFQIERRGGSSAEFIQVGVVGANLTTFRDTSVLANTAYEYRVRAFNSTGASSYSSAASVTTPSTPVSLSITTQEMPDATVNVPYSRTLSASGGKPDYTWLIESGGLPSGLSLSQTGTISGTPTAAATANFVARVTDSEGARATKALTVVVKPAVPLTITTRELPRGSVGTSYSQNLGASGGQTPYTWSLVSGNLPEGLTLNPAGIIAGTPERAGSTSFSLKLTDTVGSSVNATLSIIINPPITVLSFDTLSLPDGVLGQDYSHALKATGGNTPYNWEIVRGRLPDGLQLTEAGVIQGKPTAVGEQEFEIRLTDQTGQSLSRELAIEIDPAPELVILSQSPLALGAVGVPYRVQLQAASGTAPYTWIKKKKKKFGVFPDGITLSSDGVLSGTPGVQGTFNFTIRVVDATGKVASKPFSIEVGPPPPPLAITTELLPNATQGLPYNAKLQGGGGVGPYSWSIDSGALPDGLAMSAEGVITGRANATGATTFVVRLKDSLGTSSTKQFFIIVVPPPPPLVIQTVQLPETSAERPYSQTLSASGGVPPYTWSIASGNLGAGLNLSADGTISGTPTSAGTSVFVVRVTDSAQQTTTRTLAINIKPADKLAPFGTLETPDFRATLANTASGSGWALDNVGVVLIEVVIDGQKVGEATYGQSRPDVALNWGGFPNATNSGFRFTFDTTKFSNGEHILSIRLIDAAGNVTVIGTRPFQAQNQVLQIASTDIPRPRKGEPYNFQMVAVNGRPPYTWALISGSLPSGLSLNASGLISGTPTVFGNFSFGVRVTDSNGTSAVASLTMQVLPDAEPLRILSSGPLTEGLTGVAYNHQCLFAGGRPPRLWSILSGSLPPGLHLDQESGLIFGTPTQTGLFTFVLQLRDGEPVTVTSNPVSINIIPGPLVITSTGDLTRGTVAVNYSHTLQRVGGTGPYTWSLDSGALPDGLSLSASTGIISGTPTAAGTFTFTVKVSDTTPSTATSSTLRIVIDPELRITTTGDLTAGRVNVDYSFALQATGGRAPYTWAIVSGALPFGLTLNPATGVITGRPAVADTYTFTVQVTDGTPTTATSGSLRIVVAP